MLETLNSISDVEVRRSSTNVRGSVRWFFPVIAILMLTGLVIGFAPSFYLRGRITTPLPLLSLPAYLVVHGVVMTTWYSLFVAQTYLVAAGKPNLHRRLGVLAVAVAVVLIPVNALVVLLSPPRLLAVGVSREALYGVVLGDLIALALFAIQVGTAVYFRRKPEIHKRLMVIASFTLYGPVLARWEAFYGFHLPFFTMSIAVVIVMALYDMKTLRRLHPATLWGAVGGQLAFYTTIIPLITTGAADKVIDSLL